MSDLYVLLTGGHTGLGLGVTLKILEPGNKIGLIVRNESRMKSTLEALSEFPQELVDEIDFFYADLADQAQVKAVAQAIKTKWPRIDRLFNNAAVLVNGRELSKQGNEMHFEVNALAAYLLTTELKPLLQASSDAKVITTMTGGMHSRQLKVDQIMNGKSGFALYAQSKQAAMFLMHDLAAEWEGVKFISVDPGPNKTKMTTGDGAPLIVKYFLRFFLFNEPEVGSSRIYNGGFDPRFANENAVFISSDKIRQIRHRMSPEQKNHLLAGIIV